ncbi:MAG: outer membrane beta-barrel protein [Proteobacteria bacterium]|nr:outer membrane beta-barrel protein [Pseudomonadota bacterium]
MTHIYIGRSLLLVAAIVAQPAIGQNNRPDAGWHEASLHLSFLLASAEVGASRNAGVKGPGENTNEAPSPPLQLAFLLATDEEVSARGDATAADPGKWASDAPAEAVPAGVSVGIGASPGPFGGSDPSRSLGQRSATAGYELGKAGADAVSFPGSANSLTVPARGRAINIGNGVFVYPSLSISLAHNDNILSQAINPISSVVYNMVPGIVAELKTHGDRYTLSYLGNYTRYAGSSSDNYLHHDFFLAGDKYFTSRERLNWSLGYLESSDPRGATDRAVASEPDRWHSPVAQGVFSYGVVSATGRVEVEGSVQNKRYLNNRATTEASDINITVLSGRFFYRVMPKTSMLFEVRNMRDDYVQSVSTNDNTERRYYVGAAWEATAATTGSFKLGRLTKTFTDSSRQNFSGSSWEGALRWAPRTYSTVDMVTSKATSDSTGVGYYIVNTSMNLTWNHKWPGSMASKVSAGILKSDFAGTGRRDDTRNYEIGLFYELGRRLRTGLDWTFAERSSDQSINGFKRNVLMLSIEGTL